MKYLAFFTAVSASHYRGGTYQFSPQDGQMVVTQTQTWRNSYSGFLRKFLIIS